MLPQVCRISRRPKHRRLLFWIVVAAMRPDYRRIKMLVSMLRRKATPLRDHPQERAARSRTHCVHSLESMRTRPDRST